VYGVFFLLWLLMNRSCRHCKNSLWSN
jgi:hypothetical protein